MANLLGTVKKKLAASRLAIWGEGAYWRSAYRKLLIRYLGPERPQRFPLKVQIEATSKCNLRCPSCPHSRESRQGQHLDADELRRHPRDRLAARQPLADQSSSLQTVM